MKAWMRICIDEREGASFNYCLSAYTNPSHIQYNHDSKSNKVKKWKGRRGKERVGEGSKGKERVGEGRRG